MVAYIVNTKYVVKTNKLMSTSLNYIRPLGENQADRIII